MDEERPRYIQGGAVLVPKDYGDAAAPRRARPVEEQLSEEVEPLKVAEPDEWTMFEEAFAPGETKEKSKEDDDWILFEESFLDDDPKR